MNNRSFVQLILYQLLIAYFSTNTGARFSQGTHAYAFGSETTVPTFPRYFLCFLIKANYCDLEQYNRNTMFSSLLKCLCLNQSYSCYHIYLEYITPTTRLEMFSWLNIPGALAFISLVTRSFNVG